MKSVRLNRRGPPVFLFCFSAARVWPPIELPARRAAEKRRKKGLDFWD
jgi:hypothetical protein